LLACCRVSCSVAACPRPYAVTQSRRGVRIHQRGADVVMDGKGGWELGTGVGEGWEASDESCTREGWDAGMLLRWVTVFSPKPSGGFEKQGPRHSKFSRPLDLPSCGIESLEWLLLEAAPAVTSCLPLASSLLLSLLSGVTPNSLVRWIFHPVV